MNLVAEFWQRLVKAPITVIIGVRAE